LLLLIPVFAGTGTVPQPTVYVLQCGNGLAAQVTYHDRSITLLQGGNSNMTTEIRRHFAPRFAGTVIVADPEYSPHTAQAAAYLVEYQKADAVVLAADYLPDEIRAAQPNCPIQTGMSAPVYGGENLCAELIQTDCGNWFYITVCGQRILIPLSENDAAELPPGRRSSEILVLAHPVAHIENLRAKNIVLSCSAYQTADLLVMAGALGGNFYSVAQNGNLQMNFDAYGRLAIART
jgi:hypothetical protein